MKIVCIQITPSHLSCSLVEKKTSRELHIIQFESIAFKHLECEKLIIYNHYKLRTFITNFIAKNRLEGAYASLALTGPNLFEGIIAHPTPHPQASDFPLARSGRYVWDYQFLYHHENGSSMFYICGIPHTLLFQYQLLTQALNLHVLRITTRRMALLHTYQYAQGTAFRPAQLGLDMMHQNNMIEELFSRDLFHRLVSTKSELITPQTIPDMLTACGLYVGEKE